jgi:hypothetical protein
LDREQDGTVGLRNRLNRLERDRPGRGRCPLCRDRPKWVLKTIRQPSLDATPFPHDRGEDGGEPCPRCGWAPSVTRLSVVVVRS